MNTDTIIDGKLQIPQRGMQRRSSTAECGETTRVPDSDEQVAIAALRDSEARYRLLAEMSTDMISRHDLNGVFLYVSPACLQLLGYLPEDLVGRSAYTLIHPEDRDIVADAHYAVLDKPDTVTIAYRLHSKGDRYIWVESTSRSIADQQTGTIYEIHVASRDITKRKRAEDAQRFMVEVSSVLADSLDYQTTLGNAARLTLPILGDRCVIHLLAEDKIQAVVVAHRDPVEEVVSRAREQYYAIARDADHPVARVLRTGEPLLTNTVPATELDPASMVVAQARLDRDVIIESYLIVPLIARERTLGTITFAAGPERRYGQEELVLAQMVARRAALAVDNARLYAEAQQALALRDQFLLVAAHELRTPITTLSGHVQMAQRRLTQTYNLNERDQQALQIMGDQANRLTHLIDALLDISRLQEGKLALECVPVDLQTITERIVTEAQITLDKHSLQLQMATEPLMVAGDALRLEQAIGNLLQNAVKYSPDGGNIHIQLTRHANQACLVITDSGIGIPPEALPKLFDRFYRAANAKHHAIDGIGIGLYVVHEIIALHGGSIEVTSSVDRGTSFRVILPLLQSPLAIALES